MQGKVRKRVAKSEHKMDEMGEGREGGREGRKETEHVPVCDGVVIRCHDIPQF
jgi:hypothetical protein